MEQGSKSREQKLYEYDSYPENIRQVGEITGQRRIYIEDYVLTDIRRIFQEKQEECIVVFLGKEGSGDTKGSFFIYGSIEVELEPETCDLQDEQWDELYEGIHTYFPGAKILGWGFGVGLWTSQIDRQVRRIQEEQFGELGQILFLADLSEKEEKVFLYEESTFEELTGYFIYFARNPQMQEYMLRDQTTESFETDYQDDVTKSIRKVIKKKRTRQEQLQIITWGVGIALFFLMLFGANLLMKSLAKINAMEKTIETLSRYVTDKEEGEMVISRTLETEAPTVESTAPVSSDAPAPDKSSTAAATGTVVAAATTSPQTTGLAPTEHTTAPKQATAPPKVSKAPKHNAVVKQTVVPAGNSQMQSYIVKKGDTLSQIVWKQYHSFSYMEKVCATNHIKNCDEIYVGQCILLPEP